MRLFRKFVLLLFAQFAACFSQDANCCSLVTWDIGTAIQQALTANRALITSFESVKKADLNLEYELTEFQWKFSPNNRFGLAGGGDDGTSLTGTFGWDICKKFTSGTYVSLSPSISVFKRKDIHFNMGALVSQPLFRGSGYWFNTGRIQGAKYNYRSAVRNIHMAQIKLIVRVIAAMYEIVKQEEVVKFNNESYERLIGYVKAARLKEKIGLSDSLDIYRAETELRHAEDQLTGAQERLQEAQDIFKELLAIPLDEPVQVTVPMIYNELDVDGKEAISTALCYRIEMDQAYDNIYEQKRLAKWAQQNLLPDLNLFFDHKAWLGKTEQKEYEYDEYGKIGRELLTYAWRENKSTWGVGLISNNDLYRYSDNLLYNNSLLSLDAANRGLEQTEVIITLEVKRIIRTLKQAQKRIALQEEQIKTAEGELYLSQIKFNRGLANNFDVIQAEKNLRTAHIAYLSAVIEHINGEYQLNSAIGSLADKPCF